MKLSKILDFFKKSETTTTTIGGIRTIEVTTSFEGVSINYALNGSTLSTKLSVGSNFIQMDDINSIKCDKMFQVVICGDDKVMVTYGPTSTTTKR